MDSNGSKLITIFPDSNNDRQAGSAATTGAYKTPSYQWLSHGSMTILASRHLTDWAVPFSPTNYTLPTPPTPVSLYLTVALRNSGISCHDFMNFACHFGSVYEAQWSPKSAWVTYYLAADAWGCVGELLDKQFVAGITNVSAPFNMRCKCLSDFRESLSCQAFFERLPEHYAIAGKDHVVQELNV
jgi:hypothetical protein